jgi:DNA-binding NarL/FixJ family response regulator
VTRAAAPRASSAPRNIRVVIADDHAIVREGLRSLIEAQSGLEVIGEAVNGEQAWQRACELTPDVLLLDISMPGVGGADATERITKDCPQVKVVILTMHEERGYVTRLLRAGAAGYVLKRTASAELVRAIRAVAAGGRYVDASLAGALLAEQSARPQRGGDGSRTSEVASLTAREAEVLKLIALGHSNKEIGASLSISVKTVETHRASGMARLGVTSRAALVRFAMIEGWLNEA